MNEKNNVVYVENGLHRIGENNYILLRRGYFKSPPKFDEEQIRKRPSKLKRLLRAFIN